MSARDEAALSAVLKARHNVQIIPAAEEEICSVVAEDAYAGGVALLPAPNSKTHIVDSRSGKTASKVRAIPASRGEKGLDTDVGMVETPTRKRRANPVGDDEDSEVSDEE